MLNYQIITRQELELFLKIQRPKLLQKSNFNPCNEDDSVIFLDGQAKLICIHLAQPVSELMLQDMQQIISQILPQRGDVSI